jgi:ubiquinone biosynthesis protein UbiJ
MRQDGGKPVQSDRRGGCVTRKMSPGNRAYFIGSLVQQIRRATETRQQMLDGAAPLAAVPSQVEALNDYIRKLEERLANLERGS